MPFERRNAWQLLISASTALAQTTTFDHTTNTSPTAGGPGGLFSSFIPSSRLPSATPTSNDTAPHGNTNNGTNQSGLVQYYFVFLALLLVCVGLAVFFVFRRRVQQRSRRRAGGSRETALQRDLSGPGGWYGGLPRNPAGQRRGWQGRWRSAELSWEEGLDEHGEAPPPYLPKRHSQEQQRNDDAGGNGPAIPLGTLSRDDVGLKPPDYHETSTYEVNPNARNSTASTSSLRHHPERSTNS